MDEDAEHKGEAAKQKEEQMIINSNFANIKTVWGEGSVQYRPARTMATGRLDTSKGQTEDRRNEPQGITFEEAPKMNLAFRPKITR
ncbi:MAG: hypothetical protein MMC33_004875 [Icmadophila ericetorum]|nr:hypothetical protein [Icmadophila ericetorum]